MVLGFLGDSEIKDSTCNAGDTNFIPGQGRCPGKRNGNPLQYSCLGNPMDRGAWWATVHRVTKSWTQPKHLSMHRLPYSQEAGLVRPSAAILQGLGLFSPTKKVKEWARWAYQSGESQSKIQEDGYCQLVQRARPTEGLPITALHPIATHGNLMLKIQQIWMEMSSKGKTHPEFWRFCMKKCKISQ